MFAIGGALFYLTPGRVTQSMNQQARLTGLDESPVDADNVWVILAMAYMAIITGLSHTAARDPVRRQDLVRFLILGKAASSLGALGYFLFRRKSHAFLVNFVLDGAICVTTYGLLAAAQPQEAAR
jgi:hypothetical protein